MLKKLTIQNHADAAAVSHFDGVDAGTIFKHRVEAAAKHFSIEIPENFDVTKKGAFILGNENDLYCIAISDADANEKAETEPKTESGKVTFELEFTDSEEKGALIDLLRDAVTETTGAEMKGQTLASFEAFINKNDKVINEIVGQTKTNTFAIPQEVNAELIAQDIKDGLRPDPNAPKIKRVRAKK